mgnify:CR=1 FL=1
MNSILFIIPWSSYFVNNAETTFAEAPERAPEGVVGLATWLISKGASVKIADCQRMLRGNNGSPEQTLNDLWSICVDFQPDVIGFSFFTARFEHAAHIHEDLQKRYELAGLKKPMMIAGGVHPTLLPEVTLRFIPFDALVIGEGELPLLQLLQDEPVERIKGLYLPGGKTEKADIIEDLDELPFPDWDLIDKAYYTQPSHQISNTQLHRVMPITLSRGCLYRCNFCAHSCFLRARCHSVEYCIKKMKAVAEQCDVDTFVIQDSSIGNFKAFWEEVCARLIRMGTPYRWWANLRANQAEESFLRLMKDAGCIKLFFGFESGSPRVLERMNKRITLEQCRHAANLCHQIGIPFYTSYIINYFDEEEEDLRLTEKLILETRPTSLAINKFSPIPGSRDFEENQQRIAPHLHSIHDWNTLGRLLSPALFGNMTAERYEYWNQHFKTLRQQINTHETTD